MVFTLAVISSPMAPSPRVAPDTSRPSSYRKLKDSPSIFGSAVKAMSSCSESARKRLIFLSNSATSVAEKALSSDSIGRACSILSNCSAGAEPTRCEGLSDRTSAGKAASIALFRCTSMSYSASGSTASSEASAL